MDAQSQVREHKVYYAKISEQAERYDEMADHMKEAAYMDSELDDEERTLLAVAFKQAVGQRRASWRVVCQAEKAEEEKGSALTAALARSYRKKIEAELKQLCQTVLTLLTDHLVPRCTSAVSKVNYHKAEGDYHRYICEISDDVDKTKEAQFAKHAYEDGTKVAEESLPVTSSARLGLALNFAVFYYEVMRSPGEAVPIARKAYEDAVREIDDLAEDSSKDSQIIMKLLSDNITLWTSESDMD
jgi:14-3-3 protein epsilon